MPAGLHDEELRLTLITAFEVPAEADEAFLADWGATPLHRALREDTDFRFVAIAQVDSPDAGLEAIGRMPYVAHPGRYEVVHQDGRPDGSDGVVLINPFEVPAAADAAFLEGWLRSRGLVASERGYLGTRLHRSVGPADFRFVNVARWSSPLMFARAIQRPEFREAAMPFRSHPALYQLIRDS